MKILIAEDELMIREWLVYSIKKNRREQVLVANNGQKAYDLFCKEKPEMIISDICMPAMDGLELAKRVKEKEPKTQIVLLTCHDNFEYARKAIQYNAIDYIFNVEKIDMLINKMIDKYNTSMKNSINEVDSINLTINMRRLISDKDKAITKEVFEEYGLAIDDHAFIVIMIQFNDMTSNLTSLPNCDLLYNIERFMFSDYILALVANVKLIPSQLNMIKKIKEYCVQIKNETQSNVGFSCVHYDLSEFRNAVSEANRGIKKAFYFVKSQCFSADNVNCGGALKKINQIKDQILVDINRNKMIDACNNIYKIIDEAKRRSFEDIEILKQTIVGILLKMNIDQFNYDSLMSTSNVEALLEKINLIMFQLEEKNKYSLPINKAISFIEENFAKPIQLKDIAEHVGVSAEYFCRLFKEEVGVNFSYYLAKVRLKEAARMLKSNNDKIFDIAKKVGYTNISYFSNLFKKMYGMSPFEYKKINEKF